MDLKSEYYEKGVSCHHCYESSSAKDKERYAQRQLQIELAEKRENKQKVNYRHPSVQDSMNNNRQDEGAANKPFVRGKPKIRRNEPCPCGSGKKYKQCHGRIS